MILHYQLLRAADRPRLDHVAEGVFDGPVDPRWTLVFLNEPTHRLAVALDGDLVVGFASAVDYVHPDKPPERWINELGVAPSHQRRGIGTRLMQLLIDDAEREGCTAAWVAAEGDDEIAQALYRKLGGRVEAARCHVYPLSGQVSATRRPPPRAVTLQPLTPDNVRAVAGLRVAAGQLGLVAPNLLSIAQAYVHPEAWVRTVYADDELAGFVMLSDETLLATPPASPTVALWRFMIDIDHQGRNIGRAAMAQVIDYARSRPGVRRLLVSYVPGPASPEGFYRSLGFIPTGEIDDGEIVAALALTR